MISPLLQRKAMPARQVRLLLIFYVIRHLLGLIVFGFVIITALQSGKAIGQFAILLPVLGGVYLVTALFNGVKLFQQYQRAVSKEQAKRSPPDAPVAAGGTDHAGA